ncbi:hypothetical protein GJAV_G00108630 [Gymnothorax javanicus]|nr:hypothetical protein GJAV_G00108630 [Gymnothorax javanicus]
MYPSWGNYGGGHHQPPQQSHFGARPPHLRGPPPTGGGFGGFGMSTAAPAQSNFSSLREQHLQQMQQLQQLHQKQLQSVLHHNNGPYNAPPPAPWQGSGPGYPPSVGSVGLSAASNSSFQEQPQMRAAPGPPPQQPPPPQPAQPAPQASVQRPPPEPAPPTVSQNNTSTAPVPAPAPAQPPPPSSQEAAVVPSEVNEFMQTDEEKADFSSMSLQEQQQYWYKQHLQNLQRLKNERAKLKEPPPPPPPEDSKPSIVSQSGDPAEAARLQQLQAAAAQWQQTQQQRAGFQYQALMQQHAQLQQVLQRYQQFMQQPANLQTMPLDTQLRHYEMQQQQFAPLYQEWDRQFHMWQEQFQTYPHKDQLQDYGSQWKQWQEQMKSTSAHLQERVTTLRALQTQYGSAPYGGMMGMGQYGQYRPPIPDVQTPSTQTTTPSVPPPKVDPPAPSAPVPQATQPPMPPAQQGPPGPEVTQGPQGVRAQQAPQLCRILKLLPLQNLIPPPPQPLGLFTPPHPPHKRHTLPLALLSEGSGLLDHSHALRAREDRGLKDPEEMVSKGFHHHRGLMHHSGLSRVKANSQIYPSPKPDTAPEIKQQIEKAAAPADTPPEDKLPEMPEKQTGSEAETKEGVMSDDILESEDGFFIQSDPIPQTTAKVETPTKPGAQSKEAVDKTKPATEATKTPVSAESPGPQKQPQADVTKNSANQLKPPPSSNNNSAAPGPPQRPRPLPGPAPPRADMPEPAPGFHHPDRPMGMPPMPRGRGRGQMPAPPPPGRGRGRGLPGGPMGLPRGFNSGPAPRPEEVEYDYGPPHGEEMEGEEDEAYEWHEPPSEGPGGIHGRRPPPPEEEMWGEEEEETYQEEYYEEPGMRGPPLEPPGGETHWEEPEPEYWEEEGDPYWRDRRPPMHRGPPFPHEGRGRPPPPRGLRYPGPRRPPFPHEELEHGPHGPPHQYDGMERDPMGPPMHRDHGPPRGPPMRPDMMERDMRRQPPPPHEMMEREHRGPLPYHRDPMNREPGWSRLPPPHEREPRRLPPPHEMLDRRGPPMGRGIMRRGPHPLPPPHEGPNRGMEQEMYEEGYEEEFQPEDEEYRGHGPPHDYPPQDYDQEEEYYPPQGEWEGEPRDYPPYPPRGPGDRFRDDQWPDERERPYPYEGEHRERGEMRSRQYPDEPPYRRDEPPYPPQREWDRPLPERGFPPNDDRRPPYEGHADLPVDLPPPTASAPTSNMADAPSLDPTSPGGKGILALSQRQHEIILKAAQELKMIRELQETKSVGGDFVKSEPTENQPEIPPGLLGLEIPPEVKTALQATNLISEAGHGPAPPKGAWDAGCSDPGYPMSHAPPMEGKYPAAPSPAIAPKTVDYGHGRDMGSTVERISYGERIILRPDPLPSERAYDKEPLGPRDPYERDPYYDRRPDPYMDRRDPFRERDRDLYREKPPMDYERERYERERYMRDERMPPGPPPRSGSYREREMRSSRDRDRDGRSSRDREEHYGRPGFDRPPYDRGPERPGYEHGPPPYGNDRRPYPEERLPAPPPPPPAPPRVEKKPEMKNVDDILKIPGRESRPERIVIIMRGLPGSGKSHVAKLIRDKEVECGGAPPRVLGLDDYFMTEVEKIEKDPETGKRVKTKVLEYEYEPEMEETYRSSMLKTFRKTLDDGFFPFIIIDAINDRVKYFDQFWSAAKTKGFEVYVAEITADNQTCAKRNVHGRKLKDIAKMASNWEASPRHMVCLDIRSLLQDAAIEEVEMEDFNPCEEEEQKPESKEVAQEEEEGDLGYIPKSKWEMDTSEAKLDKLDGLVSGSKRKRDSDSAAGMEDFLQLPDDYATRMSEPGKKRVRWADLEEKKDADRKRAIGFVVGQTDWEKITDESGQLAQRALNRTKYF